MSQNKNQFIVDWKFSAEDVILGAESVVENIPIKYLGQTDVFGYKIQAVLANGKLKIFPHGIDFEVLEEIINLINKHLPDKNKSFEFFDTQGDSYGFKLVVKKPGKK